MADLTKLTYQIKARLNAALSEREELNKKRNPTQDEAERLQQLDKLIDSINTNLEDIGIKF